MVKCMKVFLLILQTTLIKAGKKTKIPDSHIVGGKDASFGSWPWQVGLVSNYGIFCGGTLISYDVVLTAAHCLDGSRKYGLSVVLGEYNRYFWEGYEQRIPVSKYEIHPSYNNEFLKGFDIAILYLEREASPSFRVRPIPALAPKTLHYTSCECYITGWGVQTGIPSPSKKIIKPNYGEASKLAVTLQEAEIEIISNSKCNSRRFWDGLVKSTNICAFYKGTAACEGDSGGPLVCKINNNFLLVGVTSWGSSSCTSYPTVFVDVSKFRDWIEEELREHHLKDSKIKIDDKILEIDIDRFPGK